MLYYDTIISSVIHLSTPIAFCNTIDTFCPSAITEPEEGKTMKPQEAQQVYDEIKAHIKKQGGVYSAWYCGITSDWAGHLHSP